MPIYTYECKSCAMQVERLAQIKGRDWHNCPRCGRIISRRRQFESVALVTVQDGTDAMAHPRETKYGTANSNIQSD